MKKLGLVGGTGPESTLIYYREINKRVDEQQNRQAFPELVIDSLDLYKVLGLVRDKRYQELLEYTLQSVRALENSGAELLAFTSGTMHIIYDEVRAAARVPVISIPETVAEYAQAKGYKRVGLLGTISTMENDYLSRSFTQRGIEVVVPKAEERQLVNAKITQELEYAVIKPESVAELLDIIRGMQEREQIEAVILGCTELPLALNEENCPVDCLDIVELHIQRLVELIQS